MKSLLPRFGILFALLGTFLGGERSARGEYWASRAGELLRQARSVEVAVVTASGGAQTDYRTEQSLRGGRVGAVTSSSNWLPRPLRVGERVLLVCDGAACPRAIGLEAGGAWILYAHEEGDGASVMPSIVEQNSLALLVQGQPAPRFCVQSVLSYTDTPAVRESIRMEFSAEDGTGTATGPMFTGGLPAAFSLQSRDGVLNFSITGRGGSVSLVTPGVIGTLSRNANGCYEVPVVSEQPFVRTPAEFRQALTSTPTPVVLGTGVLRAATNSPQLPGVRNARLSAGRSGLALTLDNSSITLRSSSSMQSWPNRIRVGFRFQEQDYYPEVLLELNCGAQIRSLEHCVASAVRSGPMRIPVFLRVREGEPSSLGTLELAHP